ncbi:MAG: helix-turn-helix transcriptional regulator [Synergistaceae bacterium]|nr:helix-turn-helix transcriptional regulator [Synergistaceae bacterium]
MALAANLRLHRKKAGFTQIELAEKLGVSIATLRRWESGETAPTGTRIIELANLLKVSPDEIINDNDNYQMTKAAVLLPHHEASNGMLVFEGEGTRIELPPTEKGYEIFQQLVANLINRRRQINAESAQN